MLIGIPRTQLYRVARTYHADALSVLSAILHLDVAYPWTNLVTAGWLPYSKERNKVLNVFNDYEVSTSIIAITLFLMISIIVIRTYVFMFKAVKYSKHNYIPR